VKFYVCKIYNLYFMHTCFVRVGATVHNPYRGDSDTSLPPRARRGPSTLSRTAPSGKPLFDHESVPAGCDGASMETDCSLSAHQRSDLSASQSCAEVQAASAWPRVLTSR